MSDASTESTAETPTLADEVEAQNVLSPEEQAKVAHAKLDAYLQTLSPKEHEAFVASILAPGPPAQPQAVADQAAPPGTTPEQAAIPAAPVPEGAPAAAQPIATTQEIAHGINAIDPQTGRHIHLSPAEVTANAVSAAAGEGSQARFAEEEAKQKQQDIRDAVTADLAKQQVDIAASTQKKLQDIEDRFLGPDGKLAEQMAANRGLWNRMQEEGRQPISDRGALWNIGAALAAGLSQFGLSVSGSGGPNVALQMIQDTIRNDIQKAQLRREEARDEFSHGNEILTELTKVFGNEKAAALSWEAQSLKQAASTAASTLARMQPQMRAAHAEELVAKLHQVAAAKDEDVFKYKYKTTSEEASKQRELTVAESKAQSAAVTANAALAGKEKKEEQASDKEFQTLKDTVLFKGRGVPELERGQRQVQMAGTNLLELIHSRKNANDLSKTQYNEITTLQAIMANNGHSVTDSQVEHFRNSTGIAEYSAIKSRGSNKPEPAQMGAFVAQAEDFVNRVKGNADKKVRSYVVSQVAGHKPEDIEKLISQLKAGDPTDTQIVPYLEELLPKQEKAAPLLP